MQVVVDSKTGTTSVTLSKMEEKCLRTAAFLVGGIQANTAEPDTQFKAVASYLTSLADAFGKKKATADATGA